MDIRTVRQAVKNFYGSQPHPQVPDVTVNEFPLYERAATILNDQILQGNKKPDSEMIAHAYHTLRNADLSPGEFEHLWNMARPVANRLLDRDPSIPELAGHLRHMMPGQIHDYYSDHPYPGYEEVKAGAVARYLRAAEPIARRYGRAPNVEEATRFAAANYDHDDIHNHYRGVK